MRASFCARRKYAERRLSLAAHKGCSLLARTLRARTPKEAPASGAFTSGRRAPPPRQRQQQLDKLIRARQTTLSAPEVGHRRTREGRLCALSFGAPAEAAAQEKREMQMLAAPEWDAAEASVGWTQKSS